MLDADEGRITEGKPKERSAKSRNAFQGSEPAQMMTSASHFDFEL